MFVVRVDVAAKMALVVMLLGLLLLLWLS